MRHLAMEREDAKTPRTAGDLGCPGILGGPRSNGLRAAGLPPLGTATLDVTHRRMTWTVHIASTRAALAMGQFRSD